MCVCVLRGCRRLPSLLLPARCATILFFFLHFEIKYFTNEKCTCATHLSSLCHGVARLRTLLIANQQSLARTHTHTHKHEHWTIKAKLECAVSIWPSNFIFTKRRIMWVGLRRSVEISVWWRGDNSSQQREQQQQPKSTHTKLQTHVFVYVYLQMVNCKLNIKNVNILLISLQINYGKMCAGLHWYIIWRRLAHKPYQRRTHIYLSKNICSTMYGVYDLCVCHTVCPSDLWQNAFFFFF